MENQPLSGDLASQVGWQEGSPCHESKVIWLTCPPATWMKCIAWCGSAGSSHERIWERCATQLQLLFEETGGTLGYPRWVAMYTAQQNMGKSGLTSYKMYVFRGIFVPLGQAWFGWLVDVLEMVPGLAILLVLWDIEIGYGHGGHFSTTSETCGTEFAISRVPLKATKQQTTIAQWTNNFQTKNFTCLAL